MTERILDNSFHVATLDNDAELIVTESAQFIGARTRGRVMRSNGLQAASYSPVADLNPSVAEALLDELKERRSRRTASPSRPRRCRPSTGRSSTSRSWSGCTSTPPPPSRSSRCCPPRTPISSQGNDDLTWAQIVAGYDTPTTTAVAPWPVYEDVDAAATDESEAPTALLPQPEPLGAGRRDGPEPGRAPDRASRSRADEDRFVPPQPPPLPRLAAGRPARLAGPDRRTRPCWWPRRCSRWPCRPG